MDKPVVELQEKREFFLTGLLKLLFPAAGIDAGSLGGHVIRFVCGLVGPDALVAIAEDGLNVGWAGLHLFAGPGFDGIGGPGPGRAVSDGEHFPAVGTDIGVIAVKDVLVDENGIARPGGNHLFFRVTLVAQVGIAVIVKTQVGAGHHAEGGYLGSQVVEVVEAADQPGAAVFKAEDFGSPRLAVAVQTDAGMPGFGPGVGIVHHHHRFSEQGFQEFQHGRMSDQVGDGSPRPLDGFFSALLVTVTHSEGIEGCRLLF